MNGVVEWGKREEEENVRSSGLRKANGYKIRRIDGGEKKEVPRV